MKKAGATQHCICYAIIRAAITVTARILGKTDNSHLLSALNIHRIHLGNLWRCSYSINLPTQMLVLNREVISHFSFCTNSSPCPALSHTKLSHLQSLSDICLFPISDSWVKYFVEECGDYVFSFPLTMFLALLKEFSH